MAKKMEVLEALEQLKAYCHTLENEVGTETAITRKTKAKLLENVHAAIESYYSLFEGVLHPRAMYLITQAYSVLVLPNFSGVALYQKRHKKNLRRCLPLTRAGEMANVSRGEILRQKSLRRSFINQKLGRNAAPHLSGVNLDYVRNAASRDI